MRLNNTQLIGLPVMTKAGELLGQVIGFEMDTDQHILMTYFIGPGKLIERIFGTVRNTQPLAISMSQVISVDNEKMIVHNSALVVEKPVRATIRRSLELKGEGALSGAVTNLKVD